MTALEWLISFEEVDKVGIKKWAGQVGVVVYEGGVRDCHLKIVIETWPTGHRTIKIEKRYISSLQAPQIIELEGEEFEVLAELFETAKVDLGLGKE